MIEEYFSHHFEPTPHDGSDVESWTGCASCRYCWTFSPRFQTHRPQFGGFL